MNKATNPNQLPAQDVEWDERYAGLVTPGQWLRTVGGWALVQGVRLAPDNAAVVVFTLDGDPKARRAHCDDVVKVCGGVA